MAACAVPETELCVYQGDTALFRFTITEDGTPADLTGKVFLMQIRSRDADSSTVLADLPYTVTGNQVDFTLSGEASRYLPGGVLRWDTQMSDPGGTSVLTFARGPVSVIPEVSRVD